MDTKERQKVFLSDKLCKIFCMENNYMNNIEKNEGFQPLNLWNDSNPLEEMYANFCKALHPIVSEILFSTSRYTKCYRALNYYCTKCFDKVYNWLKYFNWNMQVLSTYVNSWINNFYREKLFLLLKQEKEVIWKSYN